VDSAVEALLQAEHGRSGEAYNIVDRPVTQAAYLTWLHNGTASAARVWYVPQRLTAVLANFLEAVSSKTGKGPKFPRYRLLRAYHGPIYDTTKAEQELGWQPKEINI
jgi:dihydroflavonol-4-reductase